MFTKRAVTWMTAVSRNKIFQYYKLIISFKLYPTIGTTAIANQAEHVSVLIHGHLPKGRSIGHQNTVYLHKA